jgi:uncharacterized membrane protein YGL010W
MNMRAIDRLLAEYGESHQHPTNKLVHWICVPTIFWTITAMLWSVKLPVELPALGTNLNVALIALTAVLFYYIILSPPLSFGMIVFSFFCLFLSFQLEKALEPTGFPLWALALILFVVAWIFQFWGHKIEGKKPSFLKDLQFLLVGPAWLMHFIFKKIGLRY